MKLMPAMTILQNGQTSAVISVTGVSWSYDEHLPRYGLISLTDDTWTLLDTLTVYLYTGDGLVMEMASGADWLFVDNSS